ncbi:SNF2 family N-terminal domain-containing protein [Apodospora peruviana]|uniref:SNF2 family N-terminal domain-containing protein n=1 Tax=Apodospora peruviana TaxID=516989 RepID=A0AAE0HZZ0_9PEZI|nr:SNF2 family N-terminal domain-containing protein [Apodospora peruviana]
MSSLSNILNPDGATWASLPSPSSPTRHDATPSQSQQILGGLDFDALLQGSDFEDPSNLPGMKNLDFTALHEIQDGVNHWAGNQHHDYSTSSAVYQPLDPLRPDGIHWVDMESNGSNEEDTDASDVEMTNVTDESQSPDCEMVDDGDKVCYGMLYRQDVKLVPQPMANVVMSLKELAGPNVDHVQKFSLSPRSVHILLSLPDETKFGYLRDNMTKALEPLLEKNSGIEVEAVGVTAHLCEQIGRATKPDEALVQVNINIYGPRERATQIGDALSDQKLWLQRPDFYKTQFPYSNETNPHMLNFPELKGQPVEEEVRKEVAAASKPRAEEERLKKLVQEVHNSLSRANELDNMLGDQRLKTELLRHQQRALSYMLQRESGLIPDKYRLWQKSTYGGQEMFIHRITKTRSPVQVEEKGGGLLADEMGMGKSLSTLALIVQTLEAGHDWAQKKREEEHTSGKVRRHSHSTLIIVPSALLINNWLNEIKIHAGDALKTIKYHGQGRERDLNALEESDVVVTTYNTLASEAASKKSQLHKINWYRVVLDEAHIIRRPATSFYRTCADLEARSRWCLTGTPIQNRLEDIGALFAFLRAEPFHSLAQFRRFICIPFEQGESAAKDRLILLYDSLCLRRTKDILTLPGHSERTRELVLTDNEKRQYAKTMNILNRYMRQQVGQHSGSGSIGHGNYHNFQSWMTTKFGLFQAHLQLRILCNHGTLQKPFSWKKRNLKDEKAAEREAFVGELGLGSEVMCDGCRQPRPILGSTSGAGNGFVENCAHSFCLECLEDCSELPGMGNVRHCPLCQRWGMALADANSTSNDGSGGDVAMGDGECHDDVGGEVNVHHKDYFNHSGYSTKMNKLIEDVKEDMGDSKSIIFSCWTRTLDLIARHLKAEKIIYLRIDGECLLSKRQRIIDKFADDKGVQVLLMTTGTGAFGLNLTAANRIFIVEPQWNPSVENQAIARAIRLRQEKEVQVTRYYIKDTVEEEMRSQQVKKRQVALVGFAREEVVGTEEAPQVVEE